MTESVLAPVEEAIAAIKRGDMVIVVDDEDRENEGDLVIAAEHCSAESVNFLITHARGLVCLAMHGSLIDRLQLPLMVPKSQNRSGFGTPFTLSVEAIENVTTGISAPDRAQTIKTLINPNAKPSDIARPGHIFPLRAADNGVLERRGQTEAGVDLARLAELTPASVICEVMLENGDMMRLPDLRTFAKKHNVLITSVEAIAQYRRSINDDTAASSSVQEEPAALIGTSQLPTEHGVFTIKVFRDSQGFEHSLLVMGDITKEAPLVRMHSECLTGDAFGSLRCDCGDQLKTAMQRIANHGCGVLVYLRQEGRGIGLGNKIRAYELQDSGMDTVDANHQLGFPADARVYDTAAHMLKSVGIKDVRLMTNNPDKVNALQSLGMNVVEQLPHKVTPHKHNADYLQTKADRMGHTLN